MGKFSVARCKGLRCLGIFVLKQDKVILTCIDGSPPRAINIKVAPPVVPSDFASRLDSYESKDIFNFVIVNVEIKNRCCDTMLVYHYCADTFFNYC